MLKIGIIGLGTISVIHNIAIDLSPYGQLVAVCDSNPEKKPQENIPFYTSIEEMLEQEDLDCVHICLPHHLHVPIIALCSGYGVHVFSEKPISLHYQEAKGLFHLEEQNKVKIGVCLQNRYNTTVLTLKQLLDEGDFGALLGAKGLVTWCRTMDYYKEASWRGKKAESGGGVMINQAIHTLDLLSYLGGTFQKVEGKVSTFSLKETEIEDSVMCRLDYGNGGSCIFFATIAYCDNSSVELEFVFEQGKFSIKDSKLYKTTAEGCELICEDQKLEGGKHYYGASHCDCINGFYQAILQDTKNYVSVKEAAQSIGVMDCIFASSADNEGKECDFYG